MDKVDPDQFIITRKRKKYRFALFANSPLCFEFDEWQKRAVDVVEIGAGDGLFLVQLAARHPGKIFVAVDVKGDRLQKGARQAETLGLHNIFFVRARADQADELFEARSLESIWLTFSDPFPKKRSSGRRLTHPTFLKMYAKLLGHGGSLFLKHDSPDFFAWSLEQLVAESWCITELSFNLHDTAVSDFEEARVLTTYESRWLKEDRMTHYLASRFDDTSLKGSKKGCTIRT